MAGIRDFLETDHRELEALLGRACAGADRIDMEAYGRFRERLLRHIAIEEKVLLAEAKRLRGGAPLTAAAQLRDDHAAIAAILAARPTREFLGELTALLDVHNRVEEGPDGVYAECERLAADGLPALLVRARAVSPVRVAPYSPPERIRGEITRALRRAWAPRGGRPLDLGQGGSSPHRLPSAQASGETTMRTTEILMTEHRVIEQVLACLDKIAQDAFDKGAIDVASARDVISFLRTFADGCHHGKEEQRLFPAMERCGLPPQAGPTAVMRHEHEIGRAHIRKMDDAVAAFEKGDASAPDRYAFEARGFVEMLREHIAKEEQVLFPMADRMLPAAMQDELLAGFEHAEKHEMGEGTHETFLALADRLAARWGVTKADALAKAKTCSCSHGH